MPHHGRIFRVSEALQYGIVGVNEGVVTTEVAPFGGVKESGLGSEGSKYGLQDDLDVKDTCIGGIGAAARWSIGPKSGTRFSDKPTQSQRTGASGSEASGMTATRPVMG